MLTTGCRFSNDFYIMTAIDPSNGDCGVMVEMISDEGEKTILTGTVTWDDDDADDDDADDEGFG